MRARAFQQVDVFTTVPFKGNPLAVIFDADDFSSEKAQTIARWTNLSETTFICAPTQPDADYRLRIFTPRNELPFAGHPTIGSAHAVLRQGIKPRTPGRLIQECQQGLISLRTDGERILLALPACTFQEPTTEQVKVVAQSLGVSFSDILRASIVDVGPIWFTLQLTQAQAVIALRPDIEKLATAIGADVTGVTVFGLHPDGSPANVEVRSFAPSHGVPEDPVCGSGNGCVAALLRRDQVTMWSQYVAAQGQCVGRDGRVHVHYAEDGTIWLGGSAVTCVEGMLYV